MHPFLYVTQCQLEHETVQLDIASFVQVLFSCRANLLHFQAMA